ncbi:unnamed protein product, partial [Symbiodinium necroappetens]
MPAEAVAHASDVKNISSYLQVRKSLVDMTQCRPSLRRDAKVIRFCCPQHRDRCTSNEPQKSRGQREPLEVEQLVDLFRRLVCRGFAWAAVLTLLQLQCGERADCARQCRASWLRGIVPGSSTTPTIRIPRINGKTKAREIPLLPQFASLLYHWMYKSPLCKDSTTSCSCWPFPNQKVINTALLFPGLSKQAGHGQWWKRHWSKAVSERAYLASLKTVAAGLKRENRDKNHTWTDFDIDKLGTIQHVYDTPTTKRKRSAVHQAFSPIVNAIGSEEPKKKTKKN